MSEFWQPVPVVFPDAELWATGYLRSALNARPEAYTNDVFLDTEVPDPRRPRMVIVRRDGGTARGGVDSARLALRVWAPTKQEATDLLRMSLALLWAAPGTHPVLAVIHDSGPTSTLDESRNPIKYAVATVQLQGEQL